jgi:hypothetical protein
MRFFIVSLLLVAGGCASTRQTVPTELNLLRPAQYTLPLVKAYAAAVECPAPEPAVFNVSPKFKYGCFCGKGHPGFTYKEDHREIPDADLNEEQRTKLIARYLSVRPYDEIDAVCQAHDVCWIMHGREEPECNKAYRKKLQMIEWDLRELIWLRYRNNDHVDTPEWRCMNLASDMAFAGNIFAEKYANPAENEVNVVKRGATWIIAGAYAINRLAVNPIIDYPSRVERCDLESFRGKPDPDESK